jgi:hypothetical protein
MDWIYGSSGRVPDLQVQSPESKPQSHQKGKKKKRRVALLWFEIHFLFHASDSL